MILLDADYLAYMVGNISQSVDEELEEFVPVGKEELSWVWICSVGLVDWRIDNEISKLKDIFRTDNIEIYLTCHEGNFREKVAVSRPYKGTRSGNRPYYYQYIRDYLVNTYGAVVSDGCEADDMVCIRQYQLHNECTPSVIVGPDKDLDNMFGYHYVPSGKSKGLKWNTATDSAFHFWTQMIEGDRVDNISGIPQSGPAVTKKLLASCDGNPLRFADQVMARYRAKGYEDLILENGQLLHMQRRAGEMWTPDYPFFAGYMGQLSGMEVTCYDLVD